jgi:hypothetical protein
VILLGHVGQAIRKPLSSLARSPQSAPMKPRVRFGSLELLLMGQVRWVRPLDGEAFRHELLVEQLAAMKDVREESAETISTLNIELEADASSFQATLCEPSGGRPIALGCSVGMSDLGSVQSNQPQALPPSVEENVDGVTVRDRGYGNDGIGDDVGGVRLRFSSAARRAQSGDGKDDGGSPLHAAQPMAG